MSEHAPAPWAPPPPPALSRFDDPGRPGTTMIVIRAVIAATLVVGAVLTLTDDSAVDENPLTLLGSLACLVLIIAGPQPRLATKWAWFWLSMPLSLGWVVFALVEPVLLTTGRPVANPESRLTGGWAFLIGIAAGIALDLAFPALRPF